MHAHKIGSVIAALTLAAGAAHAQTAGGNPPKSAAASLAVEINKAEPYKNGCRVFLVIKNDIAARIDNAQMDLVIFNKDGILSERFVVDLGRIRKAKTIIAPIDVDGTKCDDMGSILVNDMPNCKADQPDVDCVERLDVTSRHRIQLRK
jgi:hypothetical protein